MDEMTFAGVLQALREAGADGTMLFGQDRHLALEGYLAKAVSGNEWARRAALLMAFVIVIAVDEARERFVSKLRIRGIALPLRSIEAMLWETLPRVPTSGPLFVCPKGRSHYRKRKWHADQLLQCPFHKVALVSAE